MGCDQGSESVVSMHLIQQFVNSLGGGRIEIACGFVGQQQSGFSRQGARDGDTLLLTPESSPGRCRIRSPNPTSARRASARSDASWWEAPRSSKGNMAFSWALNSGRR